MVAAPSYNPTDSVQWPRFLPTVPSLGLCLVSLAVAILMGARQQLVVGHLGFSLMMSGIFRGSGTSESLAGDNRERPRCYEEPKSGPMSALFPQYLAKHVDFDPVGLGRVLRPCISNDLLICGVLLLRVKYQATRSQALDSAPWSRLGDRLCLPTMMLAI